MADLINIISLGIGGALSIPGIISLFPPPPADPEKIAINIGFGAVNSSIPVPDGESLGGPTPFVTLFDINGEKIGETSTNDAKVEDGAAGQVIVKGKAGSSASKIPIYIQITAKGNVPVCISWITTSSSTTSGSDFRTWNGATAMACGVPTYNSTALFPGTREIFQPPCFWMGGPDHIQGMSARLIDFSFPGGNADATGTQWKQFPETLCDAPGRQQFYNNVGTCIPFYPSGLAVVNRKDENGFDADFDAIESSHTQTCSLAGIPFNNVDLGGGKPLDKFKPPQEVIDFVATASLASVLDLGTLGRRTIVAEPPSATDLELPDSPSTEIPTVTPPPRLTRRRNGRKSE